MLRSWPISAAIPVFPRLDGVCGVSPAFECGVNGVRCSTLCDEGQTCSCRPLSLEPACSSTTGLRPSALVGANDSCDLFAVPILGRGSLDEILIIDSSHHRRIVKRQALPGNGHYLFFSKLCFSGNLDFMAYCGRNVVADESDSVSIYDISRHGSCIASDTDEGYPGSAEESETEHDGFLGIVNPALKDIYGIKSSLSCMAMDEFGCKIACGTNDGDLYILTPDDP